MERATYDLSIRLLSHSFNKHRACRAKHKKERVPQHESSPQELESGAPTHTEDLLPYFFKYKTTPVVRHCFILCTTKTEP